MSLLFDGIDDASARLIIQLQLDDSEVITSSILSAQPGKRVEAAQQPELLAVLAFEEDMQRNASVLEDRRVAIVIAGDVAPRNRHRRRQDPAPAPPPPPPPLPRFPCTICQDDFIAQDLADLPCGDRYCFDCLVQTFTQSFRDEELYPPRCCRQTIPLETLAARLTQEIANAFVAKGVEFGTVNRVYCSGRGCETFLSPGMTIGHNLAQCMTCHARTCKICKGAAHRGDCPEDEASNQLLALAEAQGWKRCPGCTRMVELTVGCYHMSCLCKTQFCYVCGAHPWKACECPQWEEDRLFDHANNVVRAHNRARGVEGPAALADVIHMADRLHAHHNCDHPRFRSLRGEHDCSMCHKTMPEFIYRCVQCEILVCKRCKKNRL